MTAEKSGFVSKRLFGILEFSFSSSCRPRLSSFMKLSSVERMADKSEKRKKGREECNELRKA
jgi:hypothetical protein